MLQVDLGRVKTPAFLLNLLIDHHPVEMVSEMCCRAVPLSMA